MIKKYKNFLNESKITDYPQILKIHDDLLNLLKKNKKIKTLKHYGPEIDKYNSNIFQTEFLLKGHTINGFTDEYKFKINYVIDKEFINLWLYNIGHKFLEIDSDAKDILKTLKNYTKKETDIF